MVTSGLSSRFEVRVLVQTALLLWLVTCVGAVWEVLALQAPDSPFHFGVLSGPIAQLERVSFVLGAVLLGAAFLWPRLYPASRGGLALVLLVLGALIHTGALLYAASHGMVGVQIIDPRPDARWVVYTRGLGHALVTLGLAALFTRSWRRA